MIVKDEEHIILDALKSTVGLIDTYCIVDTGSTDNTMAVIRAFYDSHGITGTIHQRQWVDFGTNRSQALKLCDNVMDYILVIDADDTLSFPTNGNELLRNLLKNEPNSMMIQIRRGSSQYYRPQLFKANDGWVYKGVLHEYATNEKALNKTIQLSTEFWMEGRTLGNRSKSTDKYKKDIAVLEQAIIDDPTNDRYVFYLAQSYRDSGFTDKAIEFYTKRFHMGGWHEEMYVSALNISRLLNSKEWAWKAHEVDPTRNESLVSFLAHCRLENKWSQELYAMAVYASTIQKPNEALFLETDSYDWRVWDELSIIAFYTGHHETAREASEKLLSNKNVPQEHVERIRNNAVFNNCLVVR